MSQAGTTNNSGGGSGSELTFHTTSGDATSVAHIINFVGAGGTTLSAAGSTVTVTSTAAPFTPNQVIQDFDDFLSEKASVNLSKLQFINGGFGNPGLNVGGTAAHPGIIVANADGTPNFLVLSITPNTNKGPFVLGGGSLNINWVLDLIELSSVGNSYVYYIGFSDTDTLFAGLSAEPQDGCYFRYTDTVNSGNWQIVTANAGVRTTNNTSTPAVTGFQNFGVQVNSAGTSVAYTINGVAVANSPIATNIPTGNISPMVYIIPTGLGPLSQIDLFYYTQILTVAR